MASTTTNLGLQSEPEEEKKEEQKEKDTVESKIDPSTGKRIIEPKITYPKIVG